MRSSETAAKHSGCVVRAYTSILTPCPGESGSSFWSYRWSDQPTAQWQLLQRTMCGKCTQGSFSGSRSTNSKDMGSAVGREQGARRSRGDPMLQIINQSSLHYYNNSYQTGDTYPFLSIAILQVIDGLGVPLFAETEQTHWQETVLCHDDEVGEETGGGLHHTNLTIGHGYETLIYQTIMLRVTWLTLHDVTLGSFIGEGDGGHLNRGTEWVMERSRVSRELEETRQPNAQLTMSVPRSIQRMVMVPSGRGTSNRIKNRKGEISGMLEVRV